MSERERERESVCVHVCVCVCMCVCVCVHVCARMCVGGWGKVTKNFTPRSPLSAHLLIPKEDLSKLDRIFPNGIQLGENDPTQRENTITLYVYLPAIVEHGERSFLCY